MASSQVEMAATAPFGCVLRDHNRRERYRESNARATQVVFQTNLKSLVRGHLHNCISVSSNSGSSGNDSQEALENVDSSARSKDEDNKNKHFEGQSQEAEVMSLPNSAPSSSRTSTDTLPRTDSLAKISSFSVGASSLVQIWEKRLNQSFNEKMSSNGNGAEASRSNSGLSCCDENVLNDSHFSNESNASGEFIASNISNLETEKEAPRGFEAGDSVVVVDVDERYDAGPVTDDSFEDSQSDESAKEREREREREREKVRVADIIRRLSASQCPLSSPSCEDSEHERQYNVNVSPSKERERDRFFGFDSTEQQHKGFCQVISSPRILRGRQAFTDLLMQLERDRHRELGTLVDRKPVSRFSQKGRIQSMLRLKLLQRGMSMPSQDGPRRKPPASRGKLPQGSAIMHLREKFCTGIEQSDAASQRSPSKESVKNITHNGAACQRSPPRELEKNSSELVECPITPPRKFGKNSCSIFECPISPPRESLKNSSALVENPCTSNRPNETTTYREVDRIEQQKTTLVQNPLPCVNEDVREEVPPSLKVTCQETSLMAKTALTHTSEDLHEEVSPRSEVTSQGTSPMARDTLPHLSEDLHEDATPKSEVTSEGASPMARNTSRHASENLLEEASCRSSELPLQGTSSVAGNTSSQASEDLHEEVAPSSQVTWQETSSVARDLDVQETADTTTSFGVWDEDVMEEQVEDDYQYYGDYSYDWINEISRPRSYWEDLRKTWYQEMLKSNSEKGEIRQLLERRTVSNFLSSDFRERIDRLMVSRIERQTYQGSSQEEEDDQTSYDRMNQMVSFLQQQQQQGQEKEQQVQEQEHREEEQDITEEEDDDNDEEEERSLISAQYQEAIDDFDQCTSLQRSPSPRTAWSYQDHEVGDDSDRAGSASPPRNSPSPPYYPNSRERSSSPSFHTDRRHYPSSANHPSIEMELIYDMRGQMEQLYNEMSELRKAIKGCVDMQMMMQQSMKQEVHSGQEERKRSSAGLPKKGNCCICHEEKVDSLLYRCGHMCTCLKCAHELQWNSGKCPVCRAPIVDVVRAYMDY